jgi:hypothetical protein
LPWAGVVAVLMLAILEIFLNTGVVWSTLASRISIFEPEAHKIAHEQFLKHGPGLPEGVETLVVPGTSRAMAGVRSELISAELPEIRIVRLARPGMEPFQLLSSVLDIAPLQPDVVVLPVSEFDLFRPLRVEPVSDRGAGGWKALSILIASMTPAQVWQGSESLLRLGAASTLDAYRFRGLHRRVWSGELSSFDLSRFSNPADQSRKMGFENVMIGPDTRDSVDPALIAEIVELFPDGLLAATIEPLQVPMIRDVAAGEHARIHAALLRASVEALVEAGIEVILVEAPLHPAASLLYDRGLAKDFRELAEELARDPRVSFVRPAVPFEGDDFGDLLHLSREGGAKLTGAFLPELSRRLAD